MAPKMNQEEKIEYIKSLGESIQKRLDNNVNFSVTIEMRKGLLEELTGMIRRLK